MKLKELLTSINTLHCVNVERLKNHEDDVVTLITQSFKSFDDLSENQADGCIFVKPTYNMANGAKINYDDLTRKRLLTLPLSALIVDDEDLGDLPGSASFPIFCVDKDQDMTSNRIFAILCAHFYNYPQDSFQHLIGVTGTNGKTTTTHMIQKVLSDAKMTTGLIGTLGYRCNTGDYITTNCTTPYAWLFQKILRDMATDYQVQHVIMEVSSYGLATDRIYGCQFSTAVFTNFTQDHLSFHQTMDHYLRSKTLLFSQYLTRSSTPIAILNHDDPAYDRFAQACPSNVTIYSYGLSDQKSNAFIGSDIKTSLDGTSFTVSLPSGETRRVQMRIHGTFNVYNALACLAGCYTTYQNSLTLNQIIRSLETYPCAKGRFEFLLRHQPFSVVRDDANTPNGLEKATECGREIVDGAKENGRVIVIFGCNGRGDRLKRPLMGRAAEKNAHIVIVTSADARQEDPQKIIADILEGMDANRIGKTVLVEVDRKQAIHRAMDMAKNTHDLIIIAGKGHDTTQVLAHGVIPFDEMEIVQEKYQQMMHNA